MFYREAGDFKTSYQSDQATFTLRLDKILFWGLMAIATFVVPFFVTEYWEKSVFLPFFIYSIAALGLNILTGYCGQVSLGTGGFMAVGAYASFKVMTGIPNLDMFLVIMVAGLVTRRQNGHIALAGPVVNLLLFIIGIPLGGIILGLTGADVAGATSYIAEGGINLKPMIYDLVFFWITANLILGAFNMLPFGPLDGAKIKDWNEGVWFAFFSLFIGLTLLMLTGTWNAISISVSIAGLF